MSELETKKLELSSEEEKITDIKDVKKKKNKKNKKPVQPVVIEQQKEKEE